MTFYIDSSVVLRLVLRQPDALAEWSLIVEGVTSALTQVECLRTLDRAAQPLPTALGTPDAIHLATAQLWRERTTAGVTMATHDTALATAARALGMRTVGAPL